MLGGSCSGRGVGALPQPGQQGRSEAVDNEVVITTFSQLRYTVPAGCQCPTRIADGVGVA